MLLSQIWVDSRTEGRGRWSYIVTSGPADLAGSCMGHGGVSGGKEKDKSVRF